MAHLLILGWLLLRPRTVPWVPAANLQPLASIDAELARGGWSAVWHLGVPVLLLAPLGILLPLVGGRLDVSPLASMARTVFGGAMISLTIELVQSTVPGQVPDVDMVLLNTLGVALAHLLVVPGVRYRLRRRDERLRAAPPRIPRVGLTPQADVFPAGRTYF
ncbi:VanZ family protein [Streptomyces sp. NPDC057555]|uniref:VanZ family protein n=1 Tax=Streptomyces sp. NPDC057555 TaxID=3346166 RepID=UPI003686643A